MSGDFRLLPARPAPILAGEPFHVWLTPSGSRWLEFHRTPDGFVLRFPDFADFIVLRQGETVQCQPLPGVEKATLEHLFLNQVLPLVNHAMGATVFHAAGVVLGGRAIAFLAPSGSGKSTLAAAFARHGFGFLADDALTIESGPQGFLAMPGHPSIRLWEDSEGALALDAEISPPVSYTTKSRLRAGGQLKHQSTPVPLSAFYVLGSGSTSAVAIERLAPAALLVELVKFSFQLDIADPQRLQQHFDRLSAICDAVPGYRLDYPRTYDVLEAVVDDIEAHASQTGLRDGSAGAV